MIRTVDAGAGINWLQGGWAAFKGGGSLLIGMACVSLLICIVLAWIPWLGTLLVPIAGTFFYAGMLEEPARPGHWPADAARRPVERDPG